MRRVLGVCAGLIMVAGCQGSPTQTTSIVPNRSNPAAVGPGGTNAEASSVGPDANTQDLLYVSHSADGSVDVYSYSEGSLKGRLRDVRANGLCSGKNGDVFIPEGNEILRYAHGGARPIAVLHNSLGGDLQFCSVDPATGNLAVSGGAYSHFGVAIYANAKGTPKTYSGGGRRSGYWSCAYDNEGNLFVERFTRRRGGASVTLAELPKGAERFTNVVWNGLQPARLGSIQWDGAHLAVASPGGGSAPTTIYRYTVSAGRTTLVGQSALKGAGNPLQIWIRGGQIVVPSAGLVGSVSAGVLFYGYPVGGSTTKIMKDAGESQAVTVSIASQAKFAITTYHYDNFRTGWNDGETTLTYKKVQSGSFGLLHTVALDDQVDSQPLLVPDETTTGGYQAGKHDVVYVATENDTIYAIDASSGATLLHQSLGSPVPSPLGCNNNGPNVGITGTPVIDLAANVMYVVAYTLEAGVPTYRIHELSLANLTDVVPSVIVSASHQLTDGTTFTFNATYQRQRPGLLEANGNVYAGFGSFCDFSASSSRGWLLGWQTGSLAPLSANRLNDSLATSPDNFFLSAIWMSGYGVAADTSGDVYFVTGNSDPSGTTYNGVTNIQESVVKVSADLTQLLSIFTPSNVGRLDQSDEDFGSGGVLLLPASSPSVPPLAAAAGKAGTMFLLNQNNLGGYTPGGPNNDLDAKQIGGCWCGASYFARNSVQRIVASGGDKVTIWKVRTSPSAKLLSTGSSPALTNGQDPGFFTSVSSNGTGPGAIIWAVARPQSVPGPITLYAFKSTPERGTSTLPTLYQSAAGSWAAANGNANLVPVVANGKVYVASYQQLDIFGLGGSVVKAATPRAAAFRAIAGAPNEVTGTLVSVSGSLLTLRTRAGKTVAVDASGALAHERSGDLVVGEPFNVRGKYDAGGVLHAVAIVRAKLSQTSWPPDR